MTKQHKSGPPFTRQQVRNRYHAQIESGQTKMDFLNWLMDEVNAVEFDSYQLLKSVQLAHVFLDSLPKGWLSHTSGDLGALNDFYIVSRPMLTKCQGDT